MCVKDGWAGIERMVGRGVRWRDHMGDLEEVIDGWNIR